VRKGSSGMWGTARAAQWHALLGEHRSSETWGTKGAALQGVHPGHNALAGRGGPKELLSGERVLESNS
jgi:hypothetical protein